MDSTTSVLRVGAHRDIKFFFDGQIDDCLVIKRTLSGDEIEAIYHMGSGGSSADQIKYKSYDTPEGVTFTSHHTANTVHISIASGESGTEIVDVTVGKVKPPPKHGQPGCFVETLVLHNSDKSANVDLDCSQSPTAKSVKLLVELSTGDTFSVNVKLN